ncbi:conjugal transfer protein [Pseudomonas syringae pv. coryli]|uniref:Conjugal transfer protein n=1 Tax=Pseudomonas syringae pv. coryli TaxID=317659 RepID=A0A0P9MES1_9PSED|nr:conjugal transfer protein [Pseudomonas syringae pv. coryli]
MPQTRHVQQVLDIAVQALGFIAGTFQQLAAILQWNGFTQGQQAVDAAAHRGQRGTQVVGHRSQQGAAQLLGFAVQTRGFKLLGQLRTGQRLRQWLGERGQQTSMLRGERLAFPRADPK